MVAWLRNLRTLIRPRPLAILEACGIGLVAGLAAVALKQAAALISRWRIETAAEWQSGWALPVIGLLGGLLAGWLVGRFAPEASGSGIPQVKAVLARLGGALGLRVAVVKLLASALAIGSGLPLGREGPTVQVGAALASQFSRWVPTAPAYRRQLIAAGAGAGLAAAFNTPIAGVIFVIEQLLLDVSGITLGTAILASFIGAVVSRVLGGFSFDLRSDLADFQTSFFVQEIPFYLLLGVLAGVLGALFNRSLIASLGLWRRGVRLNFTLKVGLAGLGVGLAFAMLPAIFRDGEGLRELVIAAHVPWTIVAVAFVVQFVLTVFAYGSGAPGGVFAPSLLLGACLGSLVGQLSSAVLAGGSPVTYALTGMGAFFCAVTRVPVTAVVIIFEITNDFNLVLPLMVVSAIAYLVAERLNEGSIYDQLLAANGIRLPTETVSDESLLGRLVAAEVMQTRLETLDSRLSLREVGEAFSRSHHRGFPVVERERLVGIVTQSDLIKASERGLAPETPLAEFMTPQPITVSPSATLKEVLFLLNRYALSRLPVLDSRKLVGIITRSDIIRAEADVLSGDLAAVGPAPAPSYPVYQTRSPAVGRGRLLVPVSNPAMAEVLLAYALPIARERNLELECLHVLVVPRTRAPADTEVPIGEAVRLVRSCARKARQAGLAVHTQVRVAHEIARAVLETVKERRIDLVLLGWDGPPDVPGRIFGDATDTIIRQAPCEVLLVKHRGRPVPRRWLVPIGGGPNAQEALQILPALLRAVSYPEVTVCQVFPADSSEQDTELLENDARQLGRALTQPVQAAALRSGTVAAAIVGYATEHAFDGIIIGATRETLLRQAVRGNIPEAVARASNCSVVLVRL